jgi:hypothetical protein
MSGLIFQKRPQVKSEVENLNNQQIEILLFKLSNLKQKAIIFIHQFINSYCTIPTISVKNKNKRIMSIRIKLTFQCVEKVAHSIFLYYSSPSNTLY